MESIHSREIVMDDLAKSQRQISDKVLGGDHVKNWQLGNGRECMGRERQCSRAGPCAFDDDILEIIFDQLANAWRAVHVRHDFEQEVGGPKEILTALASRAPYL